MGILDQCLLRFSIALNESEGRVFFRVSETVVNRFKDVIYLFLSNVIS